MSSWRETASETAQADLDLLVGAALERAEATLEENGSLWPFAVCIHVDGKKSIAMLNGDVEAPEIVERLQRALRKDRETYRAIALVKDVALRGQNTDAIWVDLCHSEGQAMTCYLPYEVKDDRVVTGEMGAQATENHFW